MANELPPELIRAMTDKSLPRNLRYKGSLNPEDWTSTPIHDPSISKKTEQWTEFLELKFRVWKVGGYREKVDSISKYMQKTFSARVSDLEYELPYEDGEERLLEIKFEIPNADQKTLDKCIRKFGNVFCVVQFVKSLFTDVGVQSV
jgi:hypothetical protein